MRTLFNVDGPVMRAMTDIMNLVILNLLTLLCCIPIVTAGAALSAMHYILLQIIEQEEGGIARTYFNQFRGNLRDSTLPWLAVLICGILLYVDFRVFGADADKRYLVIPAYIAAAVLAMIFVWLFPLLAKFSNSFLASMKNAFLLAVGNLPRTLGMVAITAAVPFVLTQVTALLPLALLFGISLPAYLSAFLYKGVILQMVKRAQGNQDQADRAQEGEAQKEEVQEEEMQKAEVREEEMQKAEVREEEMQKAEVREEKMQEVEVQEEEMQKAEVREEKMQKVEVQEEKVHRE